MISEFLSNNVRRHSMEKKVIIIVLAAVALSLGLPDMTRPIVTDNCGQYLAGQLIIKLNSSLRGKVEVNDENGLALFGVPALDKLSRCWQVDDVTQIYRDPNPSPVAQKYGCDMQYIIQFPAKQDIKPVAESYEALGEVVYACPNSVLKLDEEPDDPLYSHQWHLAQIGAPFAWGVAKGDTSVINLVIDDGCDWCHPDIQDNLWINHPEDINGNGRFDTLPPPAGDLDGIDQDQNGYIDDVIGWDFKDGDPNPMPTLGCDHGTHCWGNINAVTNNGVGVAGATWNSRSMVVRCEATPGFVNIYLAIASIYYAVPKGIWAISMSFGSSSSHSGMADACQFAWDSGCVLYGSAGNEGSESVRYPACYEGVENVAASSGGDMKASWSNYGTWVDVTAPGDAIYATVTRAGGSYGSMSGTSMSAPLAAGVACWMKSFDLTMSNVTCTLKMHEACDSMPDPLYPQGKLGAGRVSMANIVLPLYYCDLKMTDWRFNDASGNNNGRPDPGEAAALIITYHNTVGWQNATNVSATLACTNPEVEIVKNIATFPDIPAGSSGNCSNDSFVVSVPQNMPPQKLYFFVSANASPEPAYPDTSLSVISGEPKLFIVDDDNGADYERWYTSACDSSSILYDTYNVQTSGSPTFDTLHHYPVVIWFCGKDSTTTLTATDRANLAQFLDNGGNLLISGQNIAQNISGESFLADYLHAQFVNPSTRKPFMVGIPGDPITQGDTMVAGGGGGANNGSSLDGIKPVNNGFGCAFYEDFGDTTVQAAVRYKNSYAVVFFSAPFEAIDHSTSKYLQKWTLLRRIMEYFGQRVPGVSEPTKVLPSKRPYVLHIAPNPFANVAQVQFIAPVTGKVELRTWTLTGRLVDNQTGDVTMGEHAGFRIDGKKFSNGVYIVQLITPKGVFAQKVAVLK